MAQNNGVLPIYINLIKPEAQSMSAPVMSFEEDSNQQEVQSVQENSHLIQFDRCLLGCVFYIKSSGTHYVDDCLDDWQRVIEKYGGRVVNDYDQNRDDITHVLTPNRYTDVYKKVKKQIGIVKIDIKN